ncbi:MAG: heterodisulfide reductase subunit B [Deltaproteobacteria bacterium HGW-Deltaproteobacteria-15]|jgi:heterodisulfide reductase subunit B|nr:MAG: heterodisulfide reductase subunit B [Deltaproteobacteria bacterium HGW-Deltaproteobacteria-15]
MNYAFFPGCSLESTAWDYDRSTRGVCEALDIELTDIPDWVCCGSTPAHASNGSLAVALPVLNLQKARAAGFPEVLAACASCYARLRSANHKVCNDPMERERARRVTENTYDGDVRVRHILDVLFNDVGVKEIRKRIRSPLEGLRVASYYGCLLSRPREVVAFDDAEHPTCMDELVKATGAMAVDWPYKTECCGASLSISRTAVVNRLGYRLLSMAHRAGAECIVVACSLCQLNLDFRQPEARKNQNPIPDLPVLYITQLLGLALGLPSKELGLDGLTVSAEPVSARRAAAGSIRGGRQ